MRSLLLVSLAGFLPGSSHAQCQVEQWLAGDPQPGAFFGRALDVDGGLAVVGSEGHAGFGNAAGAAYAFENGPLGWVQESVLFASDAAAGDRFGNTVRLDGDRAVIGAFRDDTGGARTGSAYVFERSAGQWIERAKLVPGDGAEDDVFGSSVALSGDTAVIGAYGVDGVGPSSGAVYVFERAGGAWIESARLVASDASAQAYFGRSVAIDGDTVFVGASGDAGNTGAAYVFERSGSIWTEVAKLTGTVAGPTPRFGAALDLTGERALVGALGDSADQGAAFVFERSAGAWQEVQKLTAGDAQAGDHFGLAVSLAADHALIGTTSVFSNQVRGAYLFERSGSVWSQAGRLIGDGPRTADAYSSAVAVTDEWALVGAFGFDDHRGSVHAWSLASSAIGSRYCSPAATNSTASPGVMSAQGSCLASAQDLTLLATDLPPRQFGFFLASANQGSFDPPGSQGTLCVQGNIARILPAIPTGAAGAISRPLPMVLNLNPPTRIAAGQTWNFQAWYRDQNPGPTSNFTDGLEITFL